MTSAATLTSTAVTLTDSTASASTSTTVSASSSIRSSATEAATSQAAATALASASQSSASASGSLASLSVTSSTSQASATEQPVTLDDLSTKEQNALKEALQKVTPDTDIDTLIKQLNSLLGKPCPVPYESDYDAAPIITRNDLLLLLTGNPQYQDKSPRLFAHLQKTSINRAAGRVFPRVVAKFADAAVNYDLAFAAAEARRIRGKPSGSIALASPSNSAGAPPKTGPVQLSDLTQTQQTILLCGYDNRLSPSGLANAKKRVAADIERLNKYLGNSNPYMPKGKTTREDLLYILTGDAVQYPSRLVTIPPDGELCSSSFSIRSDLRWVLLKPPGDNFQDGVRWATLLEFDDTPVNIKQLTEKEQIALRHATQGMEEALISSLNRLIGKICPRALDDKAPFVVTHTDVLYLVTGNHSKYPSPRFYELVREWLGSEGKEGQIAPPLLLDSLCKAATNYNEAEVLKTWEAYKRRPKAEVSSVDAELAKLQSKLANASAGFSTFSAQQTARMGLSRIFSRRLDSLSGLGLRASTHSCGHTEHKEHKSDS